MTNTSKTILFFGSGPVAAASLESLRQHVQIEAVITKLAAAHFHGPVPVLDMCVQHNLTHYTPTNKAELSSLFNAQKFNSTLGVVVDYGIIIAQDVIDAFPLGIVNSHFSLLPDWRGADPITFSVLSGQTQTGVSLMVIDQKLDEGQLIAQESMPLDPTATTQSLTGQLIELSNSMLKRYLPLYQQGKLLPYPQNLELPIRYSRKLTKADGLIDWSLPADQLERQIRAFQPWPKSYTQLGDLQITIHQARVSTLSLQPGEASTDNNQLTVGCGENSLELLRLQPAGKSAMDSASFLAGYKQRLNNKTL